MEGAIGDINKNRQNMRPCYTVVSSVNIDYLVTVKAAPHEWIIRTGQP